MRFGVVLHEMLTGRRAFQRDTTIDTMTAILKEDPPDLPIADRNIPPALVRIVERCLEKTPGARFQSTGDLAFALEALSSHTGQAPALMAETPAPQMVKARDRLAWTLVAGLALVLLGVLAIGAFVASDARPLLSRRRASLCCRQTGGVWRHSSKAQ